MDIAELLKQTENLPEEQKRSILALIQLKSQSDMEKVLNRLDVMQAVSDARFNAMQAAFKGEMAGLRYMIIGLGLLITIVSIGLPILLKFLELT